MAKRKGRQKINDESYIKAKTKRVKSAKETEKKAMLFFIKTHAIFIKANEKRKGGKSKEQTEINKLWRLFF